MIAPFIVLSYLATPFIEAYCKIIFEAFLHALKESFPFFNQFILPPVIGK